MLLSSHFLLNKSSTEKAPRCVCGATASFQTAILLKWSVSMVLCATVTLHVALNFPMEQNEYTFTLKTKKKEKGFWMWDGSLLCDTKDLYDPGREMFISTITSVLPVKQEGRPLSLPSGRNWQNKFNYYWAFITMLVSYRGKDEKHRRASIHICIHIYKVDSKWSGLIYRFSSTVMAT